MVSFFKRLLSSLHRIHILAQIGLYVGFLFFSSVSIEWSEFNLIYQFSLMGFGVYAVLIIILKPFATPTISEVLEEKNKLESYQRNQDDLNLRAETPNVGLEKPVKKEKRKGWHVLLVIIIIYIIAILIWS